MSISLIAFIDFSDCNLMLVPSGLELSLVTIGMHLRSYQFHMDRSLMEGLTVLVCNL